MTTIESPLNLFSQCESIAITNHRLTLSMFINDLLLTFFFVFVLGMVQVRSRPLVIKEEDGISASLGIDEDHNAAVVH
jgi:hypothetical protein